MSHSPYIEGPQGIPGIRGPKGEKGDRGAMGFRGEKGDDGEQGPQGIQGFQGPRGERGAIGFKGKDGKDGERGERGPKGEKGADGKDGKDGKDADLSQVRPIADASVKDHETKFDHKLIDPFLVGTKTINESGMVDGMFIRYDAKSDRLIYSTIKQVSSQFRQIAGSGLALPSQAGNSGKYLTTDGSALSWATVSGSGDVATDAIWDAKGDLAVGTGANTASKLTVGTDGHVLSADSSEPTGLKWIPAGSGSGITRSVSSVAVNTNAGSTASTDYVYFVSGTTTITLPTAVGNSNRYTIKNVGSGVVTIATTSAQTIDGGTTASLIVQYTSIDLISNGSNWLVV